MKKTLLIILMFLVVMLTACGYSNNYSMSSERVEIEDGYLIIKYDENGNKAVETEYNKDDTLDAIREYDKDGNLVHEKMYTFGDLIFEWEYVYNEEGKKMLARRYNSNKTLIETYEYDENENVVVITSHYPNEYYTILEYNEKGKKRMTVFHRDGTVANVVNY